MQLSLAEVVSNRFRARISEILQQLATQSLDSERSLGQYYIFIWLRCG